MPPPAMMTFAVPNATGAKDCAPVVLNDNTLEPKFSVVRFASTRLLTMETLPISERLLPIVTPSNTPRFEVSKVPPLVISVPPRIVPPVSEVRPMPAEPMSSVAPVLSSTPLKNRLPPVWAKVAIPAIVN